MAADTQPLWITEAEVVASLDLRGAISALESGLLLQAAGQASSLEKTHTAWGDGHTLHALGATFEGRGLVGTKTWAHAHGAVPLLVLWNAESGSLMAVIEAFALGQMRTAGLSGVATAALAAPGASRLGLVGAGAQAMAQAAAVAAVRPISDVCVFSRSADKARNLAERLGEQLNVPGRSTTIVAEAVQDADVVTTVTRAREPVVHLDALRTGVHVNAVGAITPERRELAADVVEAASMIACDSIEAARRLATDLRAVFGDDEEQWQRVVPLADVAATDLRPDDPALTLYKGMGTGIADVALGAVILERVRLQGAGRPIDVPTRVAPRLFTAPDQEIAL
jgi:ornithine cyclodeaminase/alanine dehydrogenase-like protein (mu-crystallin family)